jgi:hypothetical protein
MQPSRATDLANTPYTVCVQYRVCWPIGTTGGWMESNERVKDSLQ